MLATQASNQIQVNLCLHREHKSPHHIHTSAEGSGDSHMLRYYLHLAHMLCNPCQSHWQFLMLQVRLAPSKVTETSGHCGWTSLIVLRNLRI